MWEVAVADQGGHQHFLIFSVLILNKDYGVIMLRASLSRSILIR